MNRVTKAALHLWLGIGITVFAAAQDPAKVVKINAAIYMASTTGNVYLVTTPAGNVVIDTAMADQAEEAKRLLSAQSHGPIKYILLTHGPRGSHRRHSTLERTGHPDHRAKEPRGIRQLCCPA